MPIILPENARGPVLDLTLPASTPARDIILKNTTTGKQLTLNLPAAWAGDDLTLDFSARTITDQTGADRSDLLDSEDNELWRPAPLITGANSLEIEVAETATLSGPKSVGTVANDATIAGDAWTNPSNAASSNNVYAQIESSALNEPSQYLKGTNAGFAIPVGSTLLGMVAEVEWKCNSAEAQQVVAARLVKAGVVQATDRASGYVPTVEGYSTFGGAADLWGAAWTVAEWNNSGFGFAVALKAVKAPIIVTQVDHMRLTAHYTPGSSAFAVTAKLRAEQGYF